MQIVIDLPDIVWEKAKEYGHLDICGIELSEKVMNGTPLPKRHGRLIDADAFIKTMEDASKRQKYKELLIDDLLTVDDVFKAIIESLQNAGLAKGDAPTIIEQTKEDEVEECQMK